MWAIKMRVKVNDNPFTQYSQTKGNKVYLHTHNYYPEKGEYHFIVQGVFEGNDNFQNFVKTNEYVSYFKLNGPFFVCEYYFSEKSKRIPSIIAAFNSKLIFISPIIYEEGWEWLEIAALKKEDLVRLLKVCEKNKAIKYELFYIKRYIPGNVFVYEMFPKLTKKQATAFRLAVDHGYYNYPRKVVLAKLAKMMKISVSTYQFHLARAEAKMMPILRKKSELSDKK